MHRFGYKSVLGFAIATTVMISNVLIPIAPAYANVGEGNSVSVDTNSQWQNLSQPGSPRLLQGQLSGELESDSDVLSYFSPSLGAKGLSAAKIGLSIVKKSTDDQGKEHYLLQRDYKGLPVYGQYITAHIGTDNRMYAITNDSSHGLDALALNTSPAVDATTAVALLKSAIESETGYKVTLGGQFASRTIEQPKAELIVYPIENGYSLAYRIGMDYAQPKIDRWVGFVDAQTGAIIKKFNLLAEASNSATGSGNDYYGIPRAINVTQLNGSYALIDKTKPMYKLDNGVEIGTIETYDAMNPFFPIESSTSVFNDPDAVDAHYFAGQVYDFYASRFQRISLDGRGMSIVSVVNAGAIDNAYWDGFEIVYGDGDDDFECLSCANDIIAHELTHAVTQYSANLEYSGQPGALNESISDIMAAVFDEQDWTIGEDAGLLDGHTALRNMEQPELGLDPQPSTMSGYVNLPENEDNGGVHTNSGIPNHAAYLIATGIDAISDLHGQGRVLLGQLTYDALTSYLTPTSGFEAARDAFVLAAGDLQLTEVQQAEVADAVKAAWATVGLPYTSNENGIVSFHTIGMEGTPVIDPASHTVKFAVSYGTDLTKLAPQISVSPGASISPDPVAVRNFTQPVVYTVTSGNNQAQTWTIQGSVSNPAAANDIVGFNSDVMSGPAIIDPIKYTVNVYVEDGDDVSALKPNVAVSTGASVSPASGAVINLNQPVAYTVTAQNGNRQTWTVRAVKDSASPKLQGAVALKSNVVAAVFDHNMDLSTLANAGNYKLTSILEDFANPTITKVEVDCDDPGIVYLTTSALVPQNGYKLSVSNLSSGGRAVRPDWTTSYFLTDDTVKPVLNTARINKKLLSLTFNEYVQEASIWSQGAFTVNVNNEPVTVDKVTVTGRRVILTLHVAVYAIDKVTVSYHPTADNEVISDLSGNAIDEFELLPVINGSLEVPIIAGKDWVRLQGDVKQMIKHPAEPVMYVIFNDNHKVVEVNMETGKTKSITMDRQPERLYWSGGKLYIGLIDRPHSPFWLTQDLTGSLAILKGDTLDLIEQFKVPTDPFDLVVDQNGDIYVSSGSGQWTTFTSFSSQTKSVIDSVEIRQASYLQTAGQNKIYSITTESSPRDLSAFNVDALGHFTEPRTGTRSGYDSPYHGDYPMTTYYRISPDGNYLFNGAGTIFTSSPIKANDMIYVRSIGAFDSIVFSADGDTFYTLGNGKLSVYDYHTFTLIKQIAIPDDAYELLPGNQPGEVLIAYHTYQGTVVAAYAVDQAAQNIAMQPHSIVAQSVAADEVIINACPIPTNGAGGNDGGVGGGGIIPGGGGGGVIFPGGGGAVPGGTGTASEPSVTLGADDFQIASVKGLNGQTTDVVNPDNDKLLKAFEDAQAGAKASKDENGQSVAPRVIIPIADSGHPISVDIPASTFAKVIQMNGQAVIVIQLKDVSYALPVEALNNDWLKKALGAGNSADGVIHIEIGLANDDDSLKIRDQLQREGLQAMSGSYAFHIFLDIAGTSAELANFGAIYVTRTFTLSGDGGDGGQITALVYDPVKGSLDFVPAFVRKESSTSYADVKAPHNSIYTIVDSPLKTFADIQGHSAKNDIEIMATKKVVLGVTSDAFEPEQKVTRAEFAALLVRSLGMAVPQSSDLRFIDVDRKAWYAGVVGAASQAGLIKGDDKGRFMPNGIITRQEMAVMIGRAVKFTGIAVPAANAQGFASVKDGSVVATWAVNDVKSMLNNGIMDAGGTGKFEPALPVTRANAVVALHKMLQRLSFLN